MRAFAFLPLGLLVFLVPVPAASQYMFLDTNGDGVHDLTDRLATSGPTSVDLWVVTNQNRDGTPVDCDVTDAGLGLTINSYTVVLHAAGGDVRWGPMQNRLPFTGHPWCFASYEDTTDASWYHNGWGYIDQFPPGKYRLATLQIETLSGQPSIFIEPDLPRRVVLITQFGTSCMALEGDNTYKLGLDWHDADGLGPLQAQAGGPYEVQAGRTLRLDGSRSRSMMGAALSLNWDFGDGSSAAGAIVSHVYANAGDYTVTLTAEGGGETDTDVTTVHVVPPQAPFARFQSPPSAYVGVPAAFDASSSYDPDFDKISYSWAFGDGGSSAGVKVNHVYGSAGVYTVTLTVSDGSLADAANRTITVRAVPHPPVPSVGGPYSGIVGRLVPMNGTGSSDPDGDPLQYAWNFGDRTTGTGPVTAHAYEAPGVYTVRLTVNDGGLTTMAATTATIIESLGARAFTDGPALFVTGQSTAMKVHVEPVNSSFELQGVNPWPITLRADTAPGTEISSVADAAITADSDGNGVAELTFTFGPEDLALLLGEAAPGANVTAHLRGAFFAGGFFTAELPIHIGAAGVAHVPLRISPNPFNPEAVITFSTTKPGPVRAHLFDVHGRLVRTVFDGGSLDAGRHMLTLQARSNEGTSLASGVYFFRLTGPDGTTTRRVAIAK